MRFLHPIASLLSLAWTIPALVHADAPAFHAWAERPVMGWNSWDFYGTTVTEAQTKAQADYMADHLLEHGWDLITVDIQWYAPTPAADGEYFNYDTPNANLVMDGYGRLQPAVTRFPSAVGGAGFAALADYIHGKGLKFGIHLMRGIPRYAVVQDLPVLGTTYTAQDIADTSSTCPWNPDMYGVDMSKPGAQAYYDSLFSMYASWGVDFVKIDDLSRPYHQAEIEAIREAIDKTGRPMVFSTSPGETPLSAGPHVELHANQWRVSDDFWDNWGALYDQFKRLHDWTPYRGPGHFPDADMLPLGKLSASGADLDGRVTNFTPAEQRTLMSLWAIARSPLIHGGDMTQMDAFTLSLFTNDEVIAVNQASSHNRQLFRNGDEVVWVADDEAGGKYLAVLNTGGSATTISVDLSLLGFTGSTEIRALWEQSDLGAFTGSFAPTIASHGAALYRLVGDLLPTPWITDISGGNGNATLTWEPVAGADSYRVKRSLSENGPYSVVAENLSGTGFTDSGLSNGRSYYYVVSAIVSGAETPDSGVRSIAPVVEGVVGWNLNVWGDSPTNSQPLAGVVPAGFWNDTWIDGLSSPASLRDGKGAVTGMSLSWSSVNTYAIQFSHPGEDADGSLNKELLNGYLNSGGGQSSSVTLSGIDYDTYEIYVYFSSDVAGRDGSVSDGSSTFYFRTLGSASLAGGNAVLVQASDEIDDPQDPAANYAVFSGLSGASQTVSVNIPQWGGIAAVQVVRTSPAAEDFAGWIGDFSGLGEETGFEDDPDGDGLANGLENLFGTHPGEANAGVTAFQGNAGSFSFQHPQAATLASDVEASYVWSTDLASFHENGGEAGGTTVQFSAVAGSPTAGMNTVAVSVSGAVPPRLFFSIRAVQTAP